MQARITHRFFKRHLGQLLLALTGIAAGIAVVTGVALLRGALLESLDAAGSVLVGEQTISVRSETGRVSVRQYADLAVKPGAPDWIPVLRLPVQVNGQRFEIVAVDPLVAGAATSPMLGPGSSLASTIDMNGPASLVIANRTLNALGLDADDELVVEHQGQVVELPIAAVVEGDRSMDRRLLMDITQAQALFGSRGELSELWTASVSSDWLDEHLPPDLVWQTSAERRDSAASLTAGMRANLTAMSLLALATGMFVVYSVLNFLIVQRRHDFGMLRALGLPPSGLLKLLLSESLLLAAFGGLIGLVIGTWLADQLLALVAQPVGELYGQLPLVESAPSPGLYTAIWLLGLGAAILVSVPLVREAYRVPPGRLVRSQPPRGWTLVQALGFGLFPMLAGGLLLLLSSGLTAALAGLFLILSGMVMMMPAAGFGLLAWLGHLMPRSLWGRSLVLLQSSRSRIAPALAALTLALALAMGMAMMILGFRVALDDWVGRLLQADVYISVDRTEQAVTPAVQLDDQTIGRIAAQDGVAAWSSIRQRRLADGRRIAAYDLPEQAWPGFEWIDGTPDRGQFEAGLAVFVTEPFARNQDVAPDGVIEIPTPQGQKQLRVAAVYRDYSSDQGVIAMNGVQYRDWFDDPIRDSVGVYLQPDQPLTAWLDDLSEKVFARQLSWITPAEVRQQSLDVFDRTFRISWALALLVGLIALIALTSALLALGLERAREYATLRALGLSPQGLMQLIMVQTGGLTLLALTLAVPMALLMDIMLSSSIQPRAFGWSVPLDWPPLAPLVWTVPLAVLAGLLAGVYPALRIVRSPLIRNLRAD